MKVPNSPFSTRLSGGAKETELRLRSIFQWKKKRPPVIAIAAAVLVVALCGSLVSFAPQGERGSELMPGKKRDTGSGRSSGWSGLCHGQVWFCQFVLASGWFKRKECEAGSREHPQC